MSTHDIQIGNRRSYGGGGVPLALSERERKQHLFVVGGSGTGKSTLLQNALIQDIYNGAGVTLIDPHGDLALDLLRLIPSERVSDVLYFDPADREHPIGFNPLAGVAAEEHPATASAVAESLRQIWADSWGPRLENLLLQSLRAVLYRDDPTLLAVSKMLTSTHYRSQTLRRVEDVAVKSFWLDQFETWNPRYRDEAIAPVLNKLDRINSNPILRNILGQPKPGFTPRYVMNEGKIIIANLSRGALGIETSNLLGSLLVSDFAGAAFTRHNQRADEREPHYLVVDEAHNFVTEAFSQVLSEARKYGLHLTLATQHLGQMKPTVTASIAANVANLVALRTSTTDAELLVGQFNREIVTGQLTGLDPFTAYVKTATMRTTVPHLVELTPPLREDDRISHERKESIINRSRHHFARDREHVEQKIGRFMAQ